MDQKETIKTVPTYRIGFAIYEAVCTAIILIAVSYSSVMLKFLKHRTDSLPLIDVGGMPISSADILNSYIHDRDLTIAILCGFIAICCLNIIFKIIFIFKHILRTKWLSVIVIILGFAAFVGTLGAMSELNEEIKHEMFFYYSRINAGFGSGALWLLAGTVLLFLGMMVALADTEGPAPKKPIPADTPQEEKKEEEAEKMQEAPAPIVSEPQKKNRKWPFIIGGLIVLGLFAALAFFVFGGNKAGNDLLPVEKPAWDKFVMLTQNEVNFYKEPDLYSPRLEIMQEDIDSDDLSFYYKWSDTPTKAGFVSFTCTSNANEILPMIEEVGDWYKVVSYGELGSIECYVHKATCQEITPEPITQGLLNNLSAYYYEPATFGLQTEGKYKDFCFISVNSDMEGSRLDLAILYDGMLVNPRTKRIATQMIPQAEQLFDLGEYYDENALLYDYRSLKDGMFNAQVLGSNGTADEADLDRLFNYVTYQPSDIQEVSYYFPSIATDRIYTFPQHLTEKSALYEGND